MRLRALKGRTLAFEVIVVLIALLAAAIVLLMAATTANAGTATVEWTLSSDDDPAVIEYAVYTGGGPVGGCVPALKVWQGRNAVAGDRMAHAFTFAETGLPITIPRLCVAITAVDTVFQKESAQSVAATVDAGTGDFGPPPPVAPTGVSINYTP